MKEVSLVLYDDEFLRHDLDLDQLDLGQCHESIVKIWGLQMKGLELSSEQTDRASSEHVKFEIFLFCFIDNSQMILLKIGHIARW